MMRAAGMAVGANARIVDALVAGAAVAADGSQWLAVMDLGDRRRMAVGTTGAGQLDLVTVRARLGLDRVVDSHEFAMVPTQTVARVAGGTIDATRCGVEVALPTLSGEE